MKGGFGLAAGVLVLLSVFAEHVFHAGAVGVGILMAGRGVGALVGPFLGRWFAGKDDRRSVLGDRPRARRVRRGLHGVRRSCPTLAFAFVAVLCAHLGGGSQWSLSTYGLQRLTEDHIRGRIFSFDFAFITLTIAISSIAAGWAADAFGPTGRRGRGGRPGARLGRHVVAHDRHDPPRVRHSIDAEGLKPLPAE